VREGDEGTCATISEWPEHVATCSTRTPEHLTRAYEEEEEEEEEKNEERRHVEPKGHHQGTCKSRINGSMLPASSAIGVGVRRWKFGIE